MELKILYSGLEFGGLDSVGTVVMSHDSVFVVGKVALNIEFSEFDELRLD